MRTLKMHATATIYCVVEERTINCWTYAVREVISAKNTEADTPCLSEAINGVV